MSCAPMQNLKGGRAIVVRGRMSLLTALAPVTNYLNGMELFYAFTGRAAAHLYGVCGEGAEAELLVNLLPAEEGKVLTLAAAEGFAPREERGGVRAAGRAGTLLLARAKSPSSLEALGRRAPLHIGYSPVFVSATEDLLLHLLRLTPESRAWEAKAEGKMAVSLCRKWRRYMDMEYLIAAARAVGGLDAVMRTMKKAQ